VVTALINADRRIEMTELIYASRIYAEVPKTVCFLTMKELHYRKLFLTPFFNFKSVHFAVYVYK
jgi:hypothetical protein